MNFFIEQIAINPIDPIAAKKLLSEIGAAEWAEDHVKASGYVFGLPGLNEANLSFNYSLGRRDGAQLEFEILEYTTGENWMQRRPHSVSHLGMHCTAEALQKWRDFFHQRGIGVAQEVVTDSHTNPVIKDSRRYNYVIFDTAAILGVDLKFIVRLPVSTPYVQLHDPEV